MSTYNPKRLPYFKKYQRKLRPKQRQQALELFGNKCRCGRTDHLNFHKKDGGKHPHNPYIILKHPKDYILLCASCHRKIHALFDLLNSSGKKLRNKKEIDEALNKLWKEYGDVLLRLGRG